MKGYALCGWIVCNCFFLAVSTIVSYKTKIVAQNTQLHLEYFIRFLQYACMCFLRRNRNSCISVGSNFVIFYLYIKSLSDSHVCT